MPLDPIVRALSLLEGLSYVALLAVAMPLKYIAGLPEAVRLAGMTHGVLFILLAGALSLYGVQHAPKLGARAAWKGAAVVLLVALVPFGAFWLEARWRRGASPWPSTQP
ncbi:MAG: DUF3817 domain-containing protein [Polyangiales bacterium]